MKKPILQSVCVLLMACMLLVSCRGSGNDDEIESKTEGNTEEENRLLSGTHTSDYLSEVLNLDGKYQTSAVADQLHIGNSGSETSHGLTTGGNVSKTKKVADTGTLCLTYDTLTFAGKGAKATFTLNLSEPKPADANERIWFEVREIHENTEQGFAYSVLVNGRAAYYRSYEQIAAAPNHYFFSVARNSVSDLSRVEIVVISDCDTTFSISDIWAYTTFSELTEEQNIPKKLGIYQYAGEDLEKAQTLLAPFLKNSYSNLEAGTMFRVGYMDETVESAVGKMKKYVAYGTNKNIPVQIMNAMYWSCSPHGPDGLGGYFTDPIYSQVIYNSKTGEYYRSTPNVYSSTNWVTSGNDTLNESAAKKLTSIFSAYADSLAGERLNGIDISGLSYVMEWGVCYKGIGTLKDVPVSGALDGGDFNPQLVSKAAVEGVELNPENGLSYAEKEWLNQWTARYNQILANAYHAGFLNDAVTVVDGKVTLPTQQSLDRLFSHNVQWMNQNPSYDLRISGWKGGIGTGFYSSSEDMYFDDIRYYQYKTAYGRTGCVNLEMAIHNPSNIISDYVRQSYLQGLEFVTLFNDDIGYGTATTLKTLDTQLKNDHADEPIEYCVNLINVDFLRDVATKNLVAGTPSIVNITNLVHNTDKGLLSMQSAGSASVTFRVNNDGKTFENGLTLALQAAEIHGDSIEIYVGSTANKMTKFKDFRPLQPSDRFNSNYLCTFDLSSVTKGLNECYIKIVCTSSSKSAGIQFVKVYLNNRMKTGQTDGYLPTASETRTQNLWISARAVAENQLSAYETKAGGADAVSELVRALIEKGYVTAAYRLASGQISELLPATYAVKGSGTLGKYPIFVKAERPVVPVTVHLTAYGENGVCFSLASEREQNVTFTLTEAQNGSLWKLTETAKNTYMLTPAEKDGDGVTAATGDGVTVSVKASPSSSKKYTQVEGRAASDLSGISLKVTVQDPSISDYAQSMAFTMDNGCKYTRHAEDGSNVTTGSAAAPKVGDYVKLKFNSEGTKVVEVEAVYGKKTAKIAQFIKPNAKLGTNGTIVFTDGTSYDLEYQNFTTKITVGGVDDYARTMHASKLASLLTVGKTVTVTYCPERYNGRNQRLLTVVG